MTARTPRHHASDRVEADHERVTARLRPTRWQKPILHGQRHMRCHASVQNLRRYQYELMGAAGPGLILAVPIDKLGFVI